MHRRCCSRPRWTRRRKLGGSGCWTWGDALILVPVSYPSIKAITPSRRAGLTRRMSFRRSDITYETAGTTSASYPGHAGQLTAGSTCTSARTPLPPFARHPPLLRSPHLAPCHTTTPCFTIHDIPRQGTSIHAAGSSPTPFRFYAMGQTKTHQGLREADRSLDIVRVETLMTGSLRLDIFAGSMVCIRVSTRILFGTVRKPDGHGVRPQHAGLRRLLHL